MRLKASFLVLLFVMSLLSGCFSEPEEEKRFSWPDNVDLGCTDGSTDSVVCQEYLTGFQTPVKVLQHPVLDEIWIIDLVGTIYSWDDSNLSLVGNISQNISNCHIEQGLLGMEFTDNFSTSNTILLSYIESGPCETGYAASLVVAEGKIVNGMLDNSSLNVLYEVEQPYRNHNGGSLLSVGDNLYLWGIGDGGSSLDPLGNGQNKSNMYGTISLFKHNGGSIEPVRYDENNNLTYVLHYGLRNPWKFDVDPSGGLWIADVGQYCFEEVNLIPSWNHSSNFGWSITEGLHNFDADDDECVNKVDDLYQESNSTITLPVHEYDHSSGNCSISGGEYIDWREDNLNNSYIFGDFCSGHVWMYGHNVGSSYVETVVDTSLLLVGFGQGLNGELLLLTWSGSIYSLTFV